jgi:hypothetical protein
MTQGEALRIAEQMGYTQTGSWQKGDYVVTRPGPKLISSLSPFLMDSTKWNQRLLSITAK